MTRVLTSSPNWYFSRAADVADDQIIAFGARGDLNILQINKATITKTKKPIITAKNTGTTIVDSSTATSINSFIEVEQNAFNKDDSSGFEEKENGVLHNNTHTTTTTTVLSENITTVHATTPSTKVASNDLPNVNGEGVINNGFHPETAENTGATLPQEYLKENSSLITTSNHSEVPKKTESFFPQPHNYSLDRNDHNSLNKVVDIPSNTTEIYLDGNEIINGEKSSKTLSHAATKTSTNEVSLNCNSSCESSGCSRVHSDNVNANDCVLISTMTRLHKDKVTAVRLLKREVVHNGNVRSTDDRQYSYSVFSGADDGKVKHHHLFWEGNAFVRIPTVHSKLESEYVLPKNCKVSCLEICDEQLVIGDDKGNITSWQWKTGLVNTIKLANSAVSCLEFEKNEHLLAVGLRNGGIFIYNPQTNQTVAKLKGHDDEIHGLQWRPSSLDEQHCLAGQLISASKDRSIKLWDLKAKRCVTTGKVPNIYTGGGGSRGRALWLSVAWLPTGQVISASASGELFVWTLTPRSCKPMSLVEEGAKGHNRTVFTLNLLEGGTKLLTTSMDRSVILWDITASAVENPAPSTHTKPVMSEIEAEGHFAGDDVDGLWARAEKPAEKKEEMRRTCSGKVVLNLSTLGGYCYCIRASPVDPGRLAIGVGDDVIRIWNVNEGAGPYNITNLWQGVRAKVTSVAWHPFIEGRLAFGTEDGKVGVFRALSKKPPIICGTYHEKTVYVVSWGPQLLTNDAVTDDSMTLYSVGDGTVHVHDLSASEPALNLNTMLTKANGSLLPTRIRSEIAWSHDFSQMYLGNDDGSVIVVRRADLRCICSIKVAAKLVNAIRVQPSSDNSSARLMAIGTNEHLVKVVDLSSINLSLETDETVPIINESVLTLKHHKARLTDMCWSRLDCHKLLTVSYDGKAVVWDTSDGSLLAEYKYQKGHLLTCQWSLLDSNLVYTGSADCSLHTWRPSQYIYKASAPTTNGTTANSTANQNIAHEHNSLSDKTDTQKLIEEKKTELSVPDFTTSEGPPAVIPDESASPGATKGAHTAAVAASSKKPLNSKMTKKKMAKMLFPNMAAANKRATDADLDDLIYLQQRIEADQSVTGTEGKEHLGIYSLGKQEDMSTFLNKEKETLFAEGNYETAGYLCLWQGDVRESLERAAASSSLTDCLVNSASMLSYTEWIKYCRLYAQQLKDEGLVHKAVTYLLYTHDVDNAILWLRQDNCYREAISIARSVYPAGDPRIVELYEYWARQLKKDANYEAAAKCLVSLGDTNAALSVLNQRTDTAGAVKAVRFAMSSPDTAKEMLESCDRLTRRCLLSEDYQVIESLCSADTRLHPFYAWSILTKSLVPVLHNGHNTAITTGGVVSYIRQTLSGHNVQLQHCRKQCSLSQCFLSTKQTEVSICERLLNLAVDVEQTGVAADDSLVDVFTMIFNLHQSTSGQPKSLLTAKLIQLFTFPGCDVADRLKECSFESSQSLMKHSLYICYLWSALTIAMSDEGVQHPNLSSFTNPNGAEAINGTNAINTSTALSSLVYSHTYQLAFSLCNSLFLPWIHPQPMNLFSDYLEKLDSAVAAEMRSLPDVDVFDLVAFVEQRNPEQGMDTKAVKAVLYMLLDMFRQLYLYMCYHGDKSHLPNLSPGRQLIKEWVRLHATCYDTGIADLASAAAICLDKVKGSTSDENTELTPSAADSQSADAASTPNISAETSGSAERLSSVTDDSVNVCSAAVK